jgi:hypothetical protein
MSVEGRDWRGKRAAWLSGPEKSRQRRHSPEEEPCVPLVAEWPLSLGLDLLSSERFGREDRGIGGGEVDDGRSEGSCGGVSVDLLRAKSRAERRGGFGGGASSSRGVSVMLVRAGRGGREGKAGRFSNDGLRLTLGVEIVGRSDTRGLSSFGSSVFFRSGRGGRVAGSYSGARTRYLLPVCWPFTEDALMLVLGVEAVDMEDRAESVEARDSLDSCRVNDCSDGLRGGKLGAALSVGRLGGSEGFGS